MVSHAPRLGFDLVSVDEVRAALAAHGDRYVSRIYSARERMQCMVDGRLSAQRLAARFAAKEATAKALGRGDEDALAWKTIEVLLTSAGSPSLHLEGLASRLHRRAGSPDLAVSLSEGSLTAAAVVVATPVRVRATGEKRDPSVDSPPV
ncbi:MAG: acpS [Solirubrobacterales bacterium]|nr:acpS [Solirubrobacterales bacterium]